MRDTERKLNLHSFAELYAPDQGDKMVQSMPFEADDETGEQFEEYFGMLQTVFSGEGDREVQARMRLIALKYGYPKKVVLKETHGTV